MSRLEFSFEWIDPGAARGIELRATWARLKVEIGGQVVTRVEDHEVRSVRDAIFLPLYPIAEWAATNWWALLNEVASDSRIATGYLRRHSLAAASEGFATPQLLIEPTGEQVLMTWDQHDLREYGVNFISHGSVYVEKLQVQQELVRFIDAVVSRLEHEGIAKTFLQDEWQAIKDSSADEAEFSSLAGRLGCDPYDLKKIEQDTLIKAAGILAPSIVRELFAAVDMPTLDSQSSALQNVIAQAKTVDLSMQRLKRLRDKGLAVRRDVPPWEQGYSAAREARNALGLNGQILGSVESMGDSLGIDREAWQMAARETIDDVPSVDAVVALTQTGSPWFAVRRSRSTVRAFAICRALFEYLSCPTESAAIVVNTHSERQKRNRAFAAEFLAPAEKLREMINEKIVSEDDIQELADSLDVAPHVIRHQIENHRLATISSW